MIFLTILTSTSENDKEEISSFAHSHALYLSLSQLRGPKYLSSNKNMCKSHLAYLPLETLASSKPRYTPYNFPVTGSVKMHWVIWKSPCPKSSTSCNKDNLMRHTYANMHEVFSTTNHYPTYVVNRYLWIWFALQQPYFIPKYASKLHNNFIFRYSYHEALLTLLSTSANHLNIVDDFLTLLSTPLRFLWPRLSHPRRSYTMGCSQEYLATVHPKFL